MWDLIKKRWKNIFKLRQQTLQSPYFKKNDFCEGFQRDRIFNIPNLAITTMLYHFYISLCHSVCSKFLTLSSSSLLVSSSLAWSSVKLLESWSSWDCRALLSDWSWAFLLLSFSVKPNNSASRSLLPCTSRWRSAIWLVKPSTSSLRDVISCLSLHGKYIYWQVVKKENS